MEFDAVWLKERSKNNLAIGKKYMGFLVICWIGDDKVFLLSWHYLIELVIAEFGYKKGIAYSPIASNMRPWVIGTTDNM